MKKTYLAIIFSFALTFSCILSACGNYQPNIEDELPATETQISDSISQQINALKEQILELEQSNYITEIERNKEIKRLETLIANLKKEESQEPETEENTAPPQQDSSSSNQEEPKPDNSKPNNSEPEFKYVIENNTATITGFIGSQENLTIPSAIEGYTVTCISDEAFASSSIKSITLPGTITKIGWFAFKNCSNLKSITIPSSVISIGYSAFAQTGSDFSIICAPDSFAAQYAKSYGINYTPI